MAHDHRPTADSPHDVAHVGPSLPDGSRPVIRHKTDGTDQIGMLVPMKDGQTLPPGAELVCTEPLEGDLVKMTSLHGGGEHKGPAKAATPAYRTGYEAIFGKKTVGQA